MTRGELTYRVAAYEPTPWPDGYEESGDDFLVRREWERINLAEMPFDAMLSYRKAMNMPFDKFDREWVIEQMHREYETVESNLADYDLLSASGLATMDDLCDMYDRTGDDPAYAAFWDSMNAPNVDDIDDYTQERVRNLAELEQCRDDFYKRVFNYQMLTNMSSCLDSSGLRHTAPCSIPEDALPPEYACATKDIQTAYYQTVFFNMKDRSDYSSYLDTSLLDDERSEAYRVVNMLTDDMFVDAPRNTGINIDCSRPACVTPGLEHGGHSVAKTVQAGKSDAQATDKTVREGFHIDGLSESGLQDDQLS